MFEFYLFTMPFNVNGNALTLYADIAGSPNRKNGFPNPMVTSQERPTTRPSQSPTRIATRKWSDESIADIMTLIQCTGI